MRAVTMPNSHSTEYEALQARVDQLTAQVQALRARCTQADRKSKQEGDRYAHERVVNRRLRERISTLLQENTELQARLREEQSVAETYDYYHQAGMRPDSDDDY
ncbi:hypothetical protein SLS62_005220 [Diatrype stigma]|uniref:Uncharacterized protein n=1 Tax=Diatrype stigma TaxID=117547 RepID=A0AAN9US49_9PEZI